MIVLPVPIRTPLTCLPVPSSRSLTSTKAWFQSNGALCNDPPPPFHYYLPPDSQFFFFFFYYIALFFVVGAVPFQVFGLHMPRFDEL